MRFGSRLLAILPLILPAIASAQIAGPLGPNPRVAGPRSQVFTLGTMHLSQQPEITTDMLEPLLVRLAAFRPDIITYEGIAGEQCETIRAAPAKYGADTFDSYCRDLTAVQRSTGFGLIAAEAEIRKSLADWPAHPAPARRRRLAALFLSAGDRPSALVQWLRLSPPERRTGDLVDAEMVKILNREGGKKNENYDIAAVLAARLGHERVYPVDDHSSDEVLAHVPEEFGKDQQERFEEYRKLPLFARQESEMKAIKDGQSLLDWYRRTNAPGGTDEQIQADFGGALAAGKAPYWGRQYVGWWDVRNLRMAANVRAAFAARPGARVLNIVGSSHKPWYDSLMRQMADVEVIEADQVLR